MIDKKRYKEAPRKGFSQLRGAKPFKNFVISLLPGDNDQTITRPNATCR